MTTPPPVSLHLPIAPWAHSNYRATYTTDQQVYGRHLGDDRYRIDTIGDFNIALAPGDIVRANANGTVVELLQPSALGLITILPDFLHLDPFDRALMAARIMEDVKPLTVDARTVDSTSIIFATVFNEGNAKQIETHGDVEGALFVRYPHGFVGAHWNDFSPRPKVPVTYDWIMEDFHPRPRERSAEERAFDNWMEEA